MFISQDLTVAEISYRLSTIFIVYKALTKDLCFRTRQNREGIHRLKGPSSAREAYPALEAAAYGDMHNAAGPGRYPDLRIARLCRAVEPGW
jgi:hypothetical protein